MTRVITIPEAMDGSAPGLGAYGPCLDGSRSAGIETMDKRLNARRKGILLATATAVISGFAVFVNGYGVRAWTEISDATTYTTLKNLMAALLIGAVATLFWYRGSRERPVLPGEPRRRWMLVAIALVGGSVPFVLFFEGLSRATSAQAAFVHKTLIVWVAILALVLLRERIGWPHVAAIALLVWGQIVLVGSIEGFAFGPGELMILAATLLWSVEVVVAKKVLTGVPSSTVAVTRMAGGSIVLISWALIRGFTIEWAAVTGTHLIWILVTGFFLAGYVLTWFAALERAPAVDVTAVLVAGAIITALLQTSLRGVPLPDPVGLVLLAAGATVAGAVSWRTRPTL